MDSRATALDHQAWPSWGARKQIIILLSKVTVVTPSPQIANNLPLSLPSLIVFLRVWSSYQVHGSSLTCWAESQHGAQETC